jgi:FMN phosphatase YigB (HAD superfamily)
MVMEARWVGIDFGYTLNDGTPQRTFCLIGDVSKELGEPELVETRCHKWRLMKEKYGTWSAIKERYRPEIVSYVFDDRPGAADIFRATEQRYLRVADGAVDAIKYLRDQGIEVSIVAELKRTMGPIGTDQVSGFLMSHNVIELFDEMITPQGRVNLRDGSMDLRYKGLSKEDGNIYDLLAEDLSKRGIKTSEAVMVGDKEWSDLTPAQKRGFKAIQYKGYIYHGPSNAEYVISHFSQLKEIIKGANK